MILLNNYLITPTMFPDKTSQVWHVPEKAILKSDNCIHWKFENEAEFMHVAQLKMLVDGGRMDTTLHMPYMPYARQDKEISNDTTFALRAFLKLLNALKFSKVISYDVHNPALVSELLPGFKNLALDRDAMDMFAFEECIDFVLFPDEGAYRRYGAAFNPEAIISATKERDPATGRIVGMKIPDIKEHPTLDTRILIVDDICDGGATFIALAKLIREKCSKAWIILYVSHGIFSKGTQVLRDAGIKQIFAGGVEVFT